jgi:hypothetical protein
LLEAVEDPHTVKALLREQLSSERSGLHVVASVSAPVGEVLVEVVADRGFSSVSIIEFPQLRGWVGSS